MIRTVFIALIFLEVVHLLYAASSGHLPIVFVYTVVPAVCQYGLPEYIRTSVEQAIFTQPDCEVYLLSNIGECKAIADSVKDVSGLTVIDSVSISSTRSMVFQNLSTNMFSRDYSNELWITSALRFFMLEDLMLRRGWSEMMHVEADNMLYGRLTGILPALRTLPLAATPLNGQKSFITASVFWVSAPKHLLAFNDFLLDLGGNHDKRWTKYLDWLRAFPNCCKPGGVNPDKSGSGIRPFAINEMSMLAYFHEIEPEIMRLLPVLPPHNFVKMRYIIDLAQHTPGGSEVKGLVTGSGLWDPNSWGQFLGGTSSKKGHDKFFTDATHIAGMAIRTHYCRVYMLCGNVTEMGYGIPLSSPTHPNYLHTDPGTFASTTTSNSNTNTNTNYNGNSSSLLPVTSTRVHAHTTTSTNTTSTSSTTTTTTVLIKTEVRQPPRCYTAPFVRCGGEQARNPFHPLWNLHVHSKHTKAFQSQVCACGSPMVADYYFPVSR